MNNKPHALLQIISIRSMKMTGKKINLRSSSFILEETEDPLTRHGQPCSCRSTKNNAIGLAGFALMRNESNPDFIQSRESVPLLTVGRAQAAAENVQHSL